MKPPLYVRPLTDEEHAALTAALRSPDAFGLRRAQYLLASAKGLRPHQIAETYGGCEQTVRNALRAFHQTGLACLTPQSRRPKTVQPELAGAKLEWLPTILHQPPQAFGKSQSLWTLAALAEVAFEQGLTEQLVSIETIRLALKRLNANWKRAKQWISSPDPQYALKKSGETA
jgi:transposase